MKSMQQRMQEFVQYHINGDGECNNVVLKEWAARHNLTLQERYELAFFFSVTYSVESAIAMFWECRKAPLTADRLEGLKQALVFQSDRKYMKMKDNFERCVDDFKKRHSGVRAFLDRTAEGTTINLDKAIRHVSTWIMFGRFASFLFLETFVELTEYSTINTTIDWKNGDTATSGLLDLFGFEKEADAFDKTGRLLFDYPAMDKMLSITLSAIESGGGNTNITEVETSLCAYRKFYKGTRYNGYYLDRMLEEIYAMQSMFPDISKELISIRKAKFGHSLLGEIGGWNGIRTKRKKQYIETGLI